MKIWRLIIYGKVQGVGYRNAVYQFVHGHLFNVKGYVKNMSNGSVEVLIQGESHDLRKIEDFCYKGPSLAKVTSIEKAELHSLEELSDFIIDY